MEITMSNFNIKTMHEIYTGRGYTVSKPENK
jgi:hypothetical protein